MGCLSSSSVSACSSQSDLWSIQASVDTVCGNNLAGSLLNSVTRSLSSLSLPSLCQYPPCASLCRWLISWAIFRCWRKHAFPLSMAAIPPPFPLSLRLPLPPLPLSMFLTYFLISHLSAPISLNKYTCSLSDLNPSTVSVKLKCVHVAVKPNKQKWKIKVAYNNDIIQTDDTRSIPLLIHIFHVYQRTDFMVLLIRILKSLLTWLLAHEVKNLAKDKTPSRPLSPTSLALEQWVSCGSKANWSELDFLKVNLWHWTYL